MANESVDTEIHPNATKKKLFFKVIQTGDGNNFASENRLGLSLLGMV